VLYNGFSGFDPQTNEVVEIRSAVLDIQKDRVPQSSIPRANDVDFFSRIPKLLTHVVFSRLFLNLLVACVAGRCMNWVR